MSLFEWAALCSAVALKPHEQTPEHEAAADSFLLSRHRYAV
jgi:hypothetical protein